MNQELEVATIKMQSELEATGKTIEEVKEEYLDAKEDFERKAREKKEEEYKKFA